METIVIPSESSSFPLISLTNEIPSSSPIFRDMAKATESELHLMGGKAATLAVLLKKGFPVPPGGVVFHEPKTSESYKEIINWWKKQGSYPVAARSSASGEDSPDFSYAGQFVTLLHLANASDLSSGIATCFQAVHRTASQAYAAHFDRAEIPMHVLIQRMIDSQFSGVFFSIDPRQEDSSWLIEVVEGQGEQLVSGQVTPFRFTSEHEDIFPAPKNWKKDYLKQIISWGNEVQNTLGYKVDMEWAIDQEGQFWILQSRPITAHAAPSNKRKILDQEWQRILTNYPTDSLWDGHTFAEWTGVPTEVTFDLWQKTFQKGQAFDLALRSIGYEGIESLEPEASLLERVYGRAYLNLKTMEPVYFGRSPYRLNPFPRPHLEFDWSKLSLEMFLKAPAGLGKMAQVAWNIQTRRHELAKKALALVKTIPPAANVDVQQPSPFDAFALFSECQNLSFEQQQNKLKVLSTIFAKDSLQATFLITLLIESTTQGLMALIEKDLGEARAAESLHILTGLGMQSLASKMHFEFSQIENSLEKWQNYLNHYGHRGVGELELSHPRWVETNPPQTKKIFKSKLNANLNAGLNFGIDVQKEVDENQSDLNLTEQFEKNSSLTSLLTELSSLRRPVFKQEWAELQKLMEVREEIKMELMKPYAQIRWLLLGIGEKTQLGSDIFWLRLNEIFELSDRQPADSLLQLIQERKQKAHHLKSIDLPMFFSLNELKEVLEDPMDASKNAVLRGVCLSPGIASGVVHIVNNPEDEDLDSWPENYILVAEATDPGWTPLFERAKAVIVARGGVLSHCAIVAREMELPAVGEIRGASHLLKEGEHVWVDGNHGTIRRAN